MSILRLSRVTMRFGGLVAVNELEMEIAPRQLYGLIGPNGAGKTTVFNVITGVYTPTEGDITFEGKSIGGQRCGRITRQGVARTFQNIRLFSEMTVLDNVKVAFDCRQATTLTTAVLRTRSHKAEEDRVDSESRELLKIFKLDHLADEKAKNLPYGSQRRLEIARAMATAPRLLLLDEPAAGMNPHESNELMDLIRWIRDHFGMAILLVEHNMKVVMGVCETRARARLRLHHRDRAARRDPEQPQGHRGLPGGRLVAPASAILEVHDLSVSYGAIQALKGVSLTLGQGEIVTLIGANGAGKSTTLRAIMGLVPPSGGEVRYNGRPTRASRHPPARARRARARARGPHRLREPERPREPRDGRLCAPGPAGIAADYEKVYTLFPRLKERLKQTAGTLSGGEQQMLAIGRALMSKPKVLLLDEPSLGLAPLVVHAIFEAIEEIHRTGTPVLLVEQNANAALRHSNRAYVLETGQVALEGTSAEVAANPKVKEAYLGE